MLWIGLPGYGKTSLVKAIIYKFGFTTYTFSLRDSILTDSELIIIYLKMEPKAIAIFDNINRVKIGKKGIIENGLLKLFNRFIKQGQTLLNILICNNLIKVPPAI
jgi:Holliday junction resolvasome RuvABC ATP-dependent DNA helicase subunit